jgi:hypothetical protein
VLLAEWMTRPADPPLSVRLDRLFHCKRHTATQPHSEPRKQPILVRQQSFPNQDSMRANLESHVKSLERQEDLKTLASRTDSDSLIDLIVVTDSEAVLGIGGAWTPS